MLQKVSSFLLQFFIFQILEKFINFRSTASLCRGTVLELASLALLEFGCGHPVAQVSEEAECEQCDSARSSSPSDVAMVDEVTKKTLTQIPLLGTNAGPRDKDQWPQRLKEEYLSLIKYVENNKSADNDWFRLESNKEGTRWFGKCWYIHQLIKYEFDVEFDIPVTYPGTAPEIAIPELDGKTAKMYRGGKSA